jgi:endogenous inhibitor of DNA gyrase (YacG/DUF329 family)
MRCPTCKREFDSAASTALPFCSERCRTIDLGRWLGEAYGLPQPQNLDEDEAAPPLQSPENEDNWEV